MNIRFIYTDYRWVSFTKCLPEMDGFHETAHLKSTDLSINTHFRERFGDSFAMLARDYKE